MSVLSDVELARLAKCESARRTSERYKKLIVRLYQDPTGKWYSQFHDTPVSEINGQSVVLVASYRNGQPV